MLAHENHGNIAREMTQSQTLSIGNMPSCGVDLGG
jgi:hypothetical protein